MNRRRAMSTLLGLGLMPGAAPRAQETFPSRPIRIIVPFAPGGITDVMARLLAKPVGEALGQTVIVENKPGGGTVIGTEQGVRAKPDGYTVLMVSAPIATNPGLYAKLPYDALKDLDPVILLTSQGFVISVHEAQPYRTLAQLMEAAGKAGAEIPYASPGNGTLMHLVGQVANAEYGTRFVHVPYKGSGPAIHDASAGVVPMIIDPISTSLGPIRQGRLRPLAVTHPQRLRALPDVPTAAEAGFPKLQAMAFSGFTVPAGTPAAVVTRLNAEFDRALALPDVNDRLVNQLGATLAGGPAANFAALLQAETARWVPLIKRLGLRAD